MRAIKMHKQRIITGIEKVFEGYAQDEALREALVKYCCPFPLSPTYAGRTYVLNADGKVYVTFENTHNQIISRYDSSSKEAAEKYFDDLCFKHIHPLTLTKAKKMLEADLGKRVEELKKDYARHPEA